MEALNKEECTRQQLEGLEKQVEELKAEADKIKEPADKLKKYYHERDDLLCKFPAYTDCHTYHLTLIHLSILCI